MALYRKCCFPDCKKLWWIKLLSQVLGGTITPVASPGASPLVTRESTRIDNKDSEPRAQVRLLKFPEENQFFSKTHIGKTILSFFQCQNENECFSRDAFAGPQSGTIQKYIVTLLEELQARFDHFQELKPCIAFIVNPFIINVVSDGYSVRRPFVTNLCAVETKLTDSKKI